MIDLNCNFDECGGINLPYPSPKINENCLLKNKGHIKADDALKFRESIEIRKRMNNGPQIMNPNRVFEISESKSNNEEIVSDPFMEDIQLKSLLANSPV